MDATQKLDNNPRLNTGKVGDVGPDLMLPPEF
jgi:hypothetical protein